MNLEAFAAEVLRANQIEKNSKSDVKDLLPPQQATRSYKDIEKVPLKYQQINATLDRYYFGEERNEWTMQYVVKWSFMDTEIRKQLNNKHMEEFARKWLESRTYRDDLKYIKIKKADDKKVIFVFDIDKWMNDSIKTLRPRFVPPMTLRFRFRKDLPDYIRIDAPPNDLKIFLAKQFKDFLKHNTNKLKHKEFSFLKKITADLFTYDIDLQHSEFKATLKYSVILAGLAGYMVYKHKKEFTEKEAKDIKNKVSRFSDIKRLDRYIKRL